MRRFVSNPGFAAIVLGALILAHLAVAALLFTADRDFVYFGSKAMPEMCPFRKTFGLPCPTCGITRGVVLSLHGRLTDAVATNALLPCWWGRPSPWAFASLASARCNPPSGDRRRRDWAIGPEESE
jgi:hypothetical protein